MCKAVKGRDEVAGSATKPGRQAKTIESLFGLLKDELDLLDRKKSTP